MPAASVAVTVNVFEPALLVATGVPLGTVPAHVTGVDRLSAQVYCALSVLKAPYVVPCAGVVRLTVGAVRSIRTGAVAIELVLPAMSVTENCAVTDVPSADTVTGLGCVVVETPESASVSV